MNDKMFSLVNVSLTNDIISYMNMMIKINIQWFITKLGHDYTTKIS